MGFVKALFFRYRSLQNVSKSRFSSFQSLKNINGNIVSSFTNDVDIPEVSITDWIYSKMVPFHKHIAVECAESGKKYTYLEVQQKANNLCRALKKNWNLGRGDVVAVMLPNCPDFFIVGLGILEAGLICTTINPIYNSGEIAKQLSDCPVKLVITHSQCFKEIRKACLQIKKDIPILCIKHKTSENLPSAAINFEAIINTAIDETMNTVVDHNDLAVLLYSSGTTGLPKGVELTHRNFITILSQYQHPDFQCAISATDSHQDISVGIIPMFHVFGFTMNYLYALTIGMKVLTFPKFSPSLTISTLKNHKLSVLFAAPPLLLFLTNSLEIKPKYLETLRIVLTGAAPFGELDEYKFLQKLGRPFVLQKGYGLTETAGIVTTTLFKQTFMDICKGSTGTLAPNNYLKIIKVDDPLGCPLGPNENGEILVKSPHIMKGYFNKPVQTKEVFLDGWFKTGDIGHYNEGGQLMITDRLKELIKVKGFQVAPAELEDIIRDIPGVLDAAVIGVPHPILGEAPRAYVVMRDNIRIQPEDITKYVASKLAKFKHLEGGVELVDVIPKSLSGKILRKQLKQNYLEKS